MTNLKKISITTESREIFIVRLGGVELFREFCVGCASEVAMLKLEEAVRFTRKTTWELLRQIECGEIHSVETQNGYLLICQKSLQDSRK